MRARIVSVVVMALALLPAVAGAQEQRPDANLYKWDGQRWNNVDGFGVRLSVGPDGEPWVVNAVHEIWRSVNGNFEKLPGEALDIGVGGTGNGVAWIIGTDNGIYRWARNDWQRVPGNGVAIAVDQGGQPWVVNAQNQIFRWVRGQFVMMGGAARDIGAGGGRVWIIGTDNAVYHLQGNDWVREEGSAGERISVGTDGMPWVVNQAGQVYHLQNGTFTRMPGTGIDIAASDQVWMLGGRANRGFGDNSGRGRRRVP
jgi:hypothetical protein